MFPKLVKIPRTVLLSGLLLIAGATIGGCHIFKNLGAWLIIDDPHPFPLDVIFTFAGEYSRIAYSKKVYAKHAGAEWILSNPNKKILYLFAKEGIDISRVKVVDTCGNTRTEIDFLKHWLAAKADSLDKISPHPSDALEIGLISNWYHMRRIKMIVDAQMPKRNLAFHYLPVPLEYDGYRANHKKWWRQKAYRSIVFLEWEKCIYYWIMHPSLWF